MDETPLTPETYELNAKLSILRILYIDGTGMGNCNKLTINTPIPEKGIMEDIKSLLCHYYLKSQTSQGLFT